MKIIVVSDYERMSEEVAKIVQAQIAVKPDSVLGLATGSTPWVFTASCGNGQGRFGFQSGNHL